MDTESTISESRADTKILADCVLWHDAQVPYAEALEEMSVTAEAAPAFEAAEARRSAAVAFSLGIMRRIAKARALTAAGRRAKAGILVEAAAEGVFDDEPESALGRSIARDLVAA